MAKTKTAEQLDDAAVSISPPVNKIGTKKATALEEVTTTTVRKALNEVPLVPPKPKPPRKPPAEEIEDDDAEFEAEEDFAEWPAYIRPFLIEHDGQVSPGTVAEVRRMEARPGMLLAPYEGEYIGTCDFRLESHVDDLALYFATADKTETFTLRLKRNGAYLKAGTLKDVKVRGASLQRKLEAGVIDKLPESNVVATVNHATPTSQVIVQPPVDEDAIIDREFTRLERLKKLLNGAGDSRREEYAQQPQQLDPDMAMAQYVMKNPDLAKQAINNLIGGESAASKTGITEMLVGGLIDLVQSVAPTVAPAAANWFNSNAHLNQLKAQHLQQQMGQNGAPVASLPPQQGEPPPQEVAPPPAQEPPQQATPEDILFAQIFGACQRRKLIKPEVCAKGVLDLVDAHAAENGYSPFTNAVEIFLSADMADIIAYAATQNPMAAKMATEPDVLPWLKSVQDEIRKEWAQQDEPVE